MHVREQSDGISQQAGSSSDHHLPDEGMSFAGAKRQRVDVRQQRLESINDELDTCETKLRNHMADPLIAQVVGTVRAYNVGIQDGSISTSLQRLNVESLRRLSELSSHNESTRMGSIAKEIFAADYTATADEIKRMGHLQQALTAVTNKAMSVCYLGPNGRMDWDRFKKDVTNTHDRMLLQIGAAAAAAPGAAPPGAA